MTSFAAHLQVRYAFGVSSGRAALAVILRALHRLRPNRQTVALPAYTCFSVPAAVVRAGLRLKLVEMDLDTLDLDRHRLHESLGNDVLCVVTSSLFGLVNDVPGLRNIARGNDVFVVDDAAQSFGAVRYGRASGTLGDVGFYSLGRGKPLAGEGGIIVTDSEEIANVLQKELMLLPNMVWSQNAAVFLRLMISFALLDPRLYWIPNSLPFLKLGKTEFAPWFDMTDVAPVSSALLMPMLDKIQEANRRRLQTAMRLLQMVEGSPAFRSVKIEQDYQPTYLRFPVVANTETIRNKAVFEFHRAGIGATSFYPSAICDIGGIGCYMSGNHFHRPAAETLSRRLLTLPTHPLVEDQDLQRIAEIFGKLQTGSREFAAQPTIPLIDKKESGYASTSLHARFQ